MSSKICDTCRYWIDYAEQYDDPDEPDDFGSCQLKDTPTAATDGCGEWEPPMVDEREMEREIRRVP